MFFMDPFSADNISQREINMMYWNSNRRRFVLHLDHNNSDNDENLAPCCSYLPHEMTDRAVIHLSKRGCRY